jgi:hypothetical protein
MRMKAYVKLTVASLVEARIIDLLFDFSIPLKDICSCSYEIRSWE